MQPSNLPIKFIVFAVIFLHIFFHTYAQETGGDSILIAIEPTYDKVGKTHRFWFGENYRKLWATPVRLKIFRLSAEKGGLKILQKGGGLQTKSLRLKDSSGQEWVLRTIQKFPEIGLPEHLRATVVKDILQDQVATAHPFASLTVPLFADALGIPHSNPQIVYLPADTALGDYARDFANATFLFEEREPPGENTDNTEKVKRQLRKDNDNRVDQRIVLRARLLDMLLGDWDRHEDQWRWLKSETKSGTWYTPVPRDRDQVFYNTSGIFPWIVSHQWLMSKFQGFNDQIRDIKGFNFNARYFDRYFLNSLSEADWQQEISYLLDHLTDSVISAAVHQLPGTIYALSGERIIQTLTNRKASLRKSAIEYYRFLSEVVEVPASDKHELFEIVHTNEGNTNIRIYKIKKNGTKDKVIYERLFLKGVTREIRLYGFDGNDVFSVAGENKSPVKLRMIGGDDRDSFFIGSRANRSSLYVYDAAGATNILPTRGYAKIRTSKDSTVNTYNDQSFKYNRSGPLVMANYNIDQGLLIRLGYLHERQGFRKEPYAQKQQVMASYSTARQSYIFDYSGDFKKIFANNDLNVNVVARGPHNTANFFGIGNETEFINKGDREIGYYRSRYDIINADVTLKHPVSKHTAIYGGLAAQYYTASQSNNKNRFLDGYNAQQPQSDVYGSKVYAGFTGGLVFDSRNEALLPSRGMFWNSQVYGMKQLDDERLSYGKFSTDLSLYKGIGKKSNLVVANRVGGGFTVGNPAFFQLPGLGGAQTMRGFHTNRFVGKTILYHNLELRLKLFDFNAYILPGTVGLIGFNDIGRVWATGEHSDKWHDSYGGGIYVIPARLVLIQAVFGFSSEGVLPYVSLGFRF